MLLGKESRLITIFANRQNVFQCKCPIHDIACWFKNCDKYLSNNTHDQNHGIIRPISYELYSQIDKKLELLHGHVYIVIFTSVTDASNLNRSWKTQAFPYKKFYSIKWIQHFLLKPQADKYTIKYQSSP